MTTTEIETNTQAPQADAPKAPLLTYVEAMEDLTGHEELAIAERFGEPVDDLPVSMQLRALIFTRWVRDGQKKTVAFNDAMAMRVRQFSDYIAKPAEVDPDAEGNGEPSE